MNQQNQQSSSLFILAYLTGAVVSSAIMAFAIWNVWRNNFNMTPRWTPEFILLWGIRETIGNLAFLAGLTGIVVMIFTPSLRRSASMWLSILVYGFVVYLVTAWTGP